jgi:hypothetical protein
MKQSIMDRKGVREITEKTGKEEIINENKSRKA